MKNISDKIFGETQNTHFVFNNLCSKNRAVYKIIKGKGKVIPLQARCDPEGG